MTIDDRRIREHLERRAGAGSSEPARIADAIADRLGDERGGPWWRRRLVSSPRLAFAASAVVVVLVAAAILPSALRGPGPGSSQSGSRSPGSPIPGPAGSGYPAAEALDAAGLATLLGDDPAIRASILVIADVQIVPISRLCPSAAPCQDLAIQVPGTGHFLPVSVPADLRNSPSPYAFRVTTDGSLDLVGPVQSGPSGLGWSFAQLTGELATIRSADVAWRQLYLVEARLSIDPGERFCTFQIHPLPSPWFGCGSMMAWLVPLNSSYPPSLPPSDGLRVPNVAGVRERSDALFEAGFYLIDPSASVDGCFLCGPLGAADLKGRVLPLAELGDAGSSTKAP